MDKEDLDNIYIKNRMDWVDFYVDDAHSQIIILKKEIKKYQNRILELTKEKQCLNEKLNKMIFY